jgi:hypothetical protein
MGPMTGRAAGYCAGYGVPGFMNPYGGRMGGAFGRGRGRWWAAPYPSPPYSAEREREMLQSQVKFFEDQLTALKERIGELEAESSKRSEST